MTVIAAGALPAWPRGRLALALLLSLLLHWMIVDGWRTSGGPRAVTGPPPLQARLEPPAPDAVLSAAGEPAVESGHDRKAASDARRRPPERPAAAAQPPAAQPAGSTGPDLRFYTARELDRYPVPLTPLKPLAVDGQAGMRFWIGIDATGVVVEVTPAEGGAQGRDVSGIREMLLATRFEPAFREGRPVRSRVLLALE